MLLLKVKPKLVCKKSAIHGQGLFTKESIRKGRLIGHFEGKSTQRNGEHVLWYEIDDRWHALEVDNILKFANHSKEPNSEVLGTEMYALRPIAPGEEITFDYGEEWE